MGAMDKDVHDLVELLRGYARPMAVEPTGERSRYEALETVDAVIFDVYGTLLLSASGDTGLKADQGRATAAVARALEDEGLNISSAEILAQGLAASIRKDHERQKRQGKEYPEVEIRSLWQVLLREHGVSDAWPAAERVAARHESLVNPVWPMPGALETLKGLRERDVMLGILSNAQFYTPPLFAALLGESIEELGFCQDLCLWSYKEGEAKPSRHLFTRMAAALRRRKVDPGAVLYVGNDRGKDVVPALSVGFRTVLFAGDARSLRWRRDEDLLGEPEMVITDLRQLLQVVGPASGGSGNASPVSPQGWPGGGSS